MEHNTYNAFDYDAQQRIIAYNKRQGSSFAEEDVIAALEAIYDAMLGAETMVAEMVDRHGDHFIAQLLNAGLTAPSLDNEPYLETEIANQSYLFITRMETLFTRVEAYLNNNAKSALSLYHGNSHAMKALDAALAWKTFDNSAALVEQVQERVVRDIERVVVQTEQRFNEQRQRRFGFTHYIWRSRDDDKVRSLHASHDNGVFRWDNPPEGGHPGHAFGCRCISEPYLAGLFANPLDDPSSGAIEPVYPEFYVIGGAALKTAGKIVKKVGRKINRYRLINSTNKNVRDILLPNGKLIGKKGKGAKIRIVSGGATAGRKLFDKLRKNGTLEKNPTYNGVAYRLPNGDRVGFRTQTKSRSPAIDLDVKGINIKRIHF